MIVTMPKAKERKRKAHKTHEPGQVIDGVRFLNSAVPLTHAEPPQPIAPLYTAKCEVCGHGYSELMVKASIGIKTCLCDECRSDAVAVRALAFQDECGVNLGWRVVDHADHSIRSWGRGELPMGMRNV